MWLILGIEDGLGHTTFGVGCGLFLPLSDPRFREMKFRS
jgi:hypothetical protein